MTKKAYNKLIAGHLQWSLVGLIIALFVAFVCSDHRSVVYGSPLTPRGGTDLPAAESGAFEVLAPSTSIASAPIESGGLTSVSPAVAPSPPAPKGSPLTPKGGMLVVPDTINGELVWPDPWDRITETERPFY